MIMDTHAKVKQVKDTETPYLFIDKDILKENVKRFMSSLPDSSIYYSVKANNTPEVLSILKKEGVNFDVASWEEIKILKKLGVGPNRMVFSAPTKIPRDIKNAYDFGITTYAFDSRMEVEKLSTIAPGSQVIARLIVDNTGSEWPLIRKFGLTNEEAITYMSYAKEKGLVPFGLSFHVGSQNLRPLSWKRALEKTYRVWKELKRKNIHLPVINLGGGFPVEYTKNVPQIEDVAEIISKAKTDLFNNEVTFYIEPGRRMVGNSGILVASVISRARRGLAEWLYLDTGVFHGFQETLEGFRYVVRTDKKHEKEKLYVLSGPTCDSTDVIMEDVLLPDNMSLGDKLYFFSCGAYSTSYERYNGFRYPETIIF